MAQLMPLPLTVSCFSKIQIGFTFLVPAHPGSPGQRAVKRARARVCVWRCHIQWTRTRRDLVYCIGAICHRAYKPRMLYAYSMLCVQYVRQCSVWEVQSRVEFLRIRRTPQVAAPAPAVKGRRRRRRRLGDWIRPATDRPTDWWDASVDGGDTCSET